MKEVASLNICRAFYGPDVLPRGIIINTRADEDDASEVSETPPVPPEGAEGEARAAADQAAQGTPGRSAEAAADQAAQGTPGRPASSAVSLEHGESPESLRAPRGKGLRGKGFSQRPHIRVNIPENPYEADTDSDESAGERACARSGVEIILYMLESFGGNDDVRLMGYMADLKQFRRRPGEPLEEAFTRWDIITERIERHGISIGEPLHIAHDWIDCLFIPREVLPQILLELNETKTLPRTEEDLQKFRKALISHSRLLDYTSPQSLFPDKQQRPPAAAYPVNHGDASSQVWMMNSWNMDSRTGSTGWSDSEWWGEYYDVPDSRPINPTGIYMGDTGGSSTCEWCKDPAAAVHEEDCLVDTDTEDDDGAADPEYDRFC